MENIYLTIVLAPLVGAILAGFFGSTLGRKGAHWVTSTGVGISALLSLYVLKGFMYDGLETFNGTVYTWMVSGGLSMEVGFLVDHLTAVMITVVTFVSFCVHIYTIGYMADDEHNWPKTSLAGKNSYQRFFSYISLFTFSMLMLVMANNFMQLFFGWEAVGLVSYLLIGFWSVRPTAIFANLKAFLVNRVGDFGFILGIAAIVMYTNSLDYAEVFALAPGLVDTQVQIWGDSSWSLMTVIGILLFIGAMGKSAQVPLHVWLPDSMEGPTPISALIHAATMVTAGIFMVARMSPLYELSETALSFILVIGATTAFFTGLIGIVQNDIKRVVAYSTLSQLGYMMVALGASAYAAGIFHLMTHAFFKALLFLAAGSVIIGMHHDQDIRNMGGVRKYMPITYWTSLLGSLALIGFPGFSGFFSKDAIIEAVHHSTIAGSGYAYWLVLAGVFVTALYSFRMFFLVFHGEGPRDEHAKEHLHESPKVVTVPLILLAIPSVILGYLTIDAMLFGDWFKDALYVLPEHDTLAAVQTMVHSGNGMLGHTFASVAFYLAMAGLGLAFYLYMINPALAEKIKNTLAPLHKVLDKKYWFDEVYQAVFAAGSRGIGKFLWLVGDRGLIDGLAVNGSAHTVGWLASIVRHVQTGYLYHYAIAMILGLLLLLTWFVYL
ncbi:MAG: NADH-quinone oxidoreductase subunit L [Candidatus Thiodiazotropha lotti]|uniref:NADH-quinone oxidoreductase subunit L n=1 Tax=Candidatus Thiodiazotropha endoloripes TaxID=1818881 RepID=A0A1E2UIE3_9GAMM|nr:NADH-quinone oxidoreductase subunit L [Candidatus Thiodiazotropha endoloripes]MCG7899584.1 NADH-quinone oxidoreductase subunit L [Candidatus Thiodiazotropha weberae]MCG7992675.1 NADH-quinone oxidoreductase subunit L [Candidatus Thiodiazotropha lotti]MCG7901877.1 NADH-quinone oxidoreductase subunit L [Candidatus Thiodiazotropha weberae]MCG7912256.1 NADH-quinone oxidoreductase subunit L [Candidatus Thiodiazotropha weberae]MCG7998740.1 NADH-quinone oxidoreductase subunit L [Candidatus Thiodiaz